MQTPDAADGVMLLAVATDIVWCNIDEMGGNSKGAKNVSHRQTMCLE